ncbi:hypothetical protein TPA0910_13090 [Streptomyces hygroscopicus subsp. sporocinereus]|uniref:Uncharacterized protein n=1 Tax=Streptomyces hygroscopicus TaxID=1912 RepID=A0ABQ3TU59_STRHY|nr:hypothetical protein TPA0910_13090 [Streptomyces hygroscopicus]
MPLGETGPLEADTPGPPDDWADRHVLTWPGDWLAPGLGVPYRDGVNLLLNPTCRAGQQPVRAGCGMRDAGREESSRAGGDFAAG